ncbi:MAG: hypothetical protein JW958_10500 [Candidatus Eisenbacteria bacterium]|nr:hypothetical protein [Candidatus Eisenbacteria bacterium]
MTAGERAPRIEERGRSAPRRFFPHIALLLIALFEVVFGVAARPGDADLSRLAREGTPREKVSAIFIRTNRDVPAPISAEELGRVLAEEPRLVREWTMTSNFSRFGHEKRLHAYADSLSETPHGARCRFLLNHRVGSFVWDHGVIRYEWITLDELDVFLRSEENDR